jgi:hypothetical protein
MCSGRLWKQASLFIGAHFENLEGGSLTRDFEGQIKEGSGNGASLSVGALWGEPGGRAPLLGTLKAMLSKALETGVFFQRGPVLGNMKGLLLSQGLTEKGEIFLSGKVVGGSERH